MFCFVGMNIFVAFFVLLLLLADSTPSDASSVPLIGTVVPLENAHTVLSLSTVELL